MQNYLLVPLCSLEHKHSSKLYTPELNLLIEHLKLRELFMKSFVLMAFLFYGLGVEAVTDDSIHSISKGSGGEPHLVKFNSGEVKFIEPADYHTLSKYQKRLKTSQLYTHSAPEEKVLNPDEINFEPTLVSDDEIQRIFKNFNPYMKRKSECSDRAHVWAWDEFTRTGTKSEKAFLMLTDTYIKRHRYKWWFHVAPMFTTSSGQKMVMDFQFLDKPVTFTEWKNNLVFTKRECVTEFSFLAYDAGADQTQDCYVKFEPMYYYIPGDIGNRERGRGKTDWSSSEVRASRARAFFKGSL